ncbi:gas vesicle protein GvpO [Haladaptatus halobius]|uniref:gas vesicle protein GvpO n=1 Tax=Haladaptatus halobius TaxID=2884875 RepID=UPI001D09D293|nr:gas vesicle protein GvpO [Haladaptatus halobius]
MSERTDGSGDGFGEVVDRLTDAVEESERDAGSEIPETDGKIGVIDARDVGRAVAEDLTGLPLDGIVEVDDHEEGWRVIAEVVKRHSIPDTQDILDRYVISLDTTGGVRGYSRVGRYRRGNLGEQREIFAANDAEGGTI